MLSMSTLVARVPPLLASLMLLSRSVCLEVTLSTRSIHSLMRDGYGEHCVKAALTLCQDHSSTAEDPSLTGTLSDRNLTSGTRNPNRHEVPGFPIGRRSRHCQDLKDAGDTGSGVREVFPYRCCPDWGVLVYCDHEVDGGGWTVFQRRADIVPREDFYRTWVEYEEGFGNQSQEFWLGLELLHEFTTFGLQELRVDLGDCEGNTRFAQYGFFHVASAADKYKMHCGRYTGDAGDSLVGHCGHIFATHDRDQNSCAKSFLGGWWYRNCHDSNLNGKYYGGKTDQSSKGIVWETFKDHSYSLCYSEMKVRPAKP